MTRKLIINGKPVETDQQGFLCKLEDWSEDFAREIARQDGLELFTDHWELIGYFREYFAQHQKNPTMHSMVVSLGKTKGDVFHDQKAYEKHIYGLFPSDPVPELCKLAGLPLPRPDT